MNKLYMINVCKFQRTENSVWEKGLVFNEGDGLLIDANGKVVEGEIWDLKQIYSELTISKLDVVLDNEMYKKAMEEVLPSPTSVIPSIEKVETKYYGYTL